jgi:membrane protein DedA with SNARE-associated domain
MREGGSASHRLATYLDAVFEPWPWGVSGVHDVSSVLQIESFFDLDNFGVVKLFSLLVLPFADEDFAILFGSYFVVNKSMPIGLVAITIYCGIVASDFAVYGVGAAARHFKWLDRLAVSERVRTFATTLTRNQFELVAVCRVVPGLELIAFVACGWMGVPFGRFMLASIVVSAFYLPLMLYLVVALGYGLGSQVGPWAWPLMVMFLGTVAFARHRIFTLREPISATADVAHSLRPAMRYHFVPASRPAFRMWRPRLSRVTAAKRRDR